MVTAGLAFGSCILCPLLKIHILQTSYTANVLRWWTCQQFQQTTSIFVNGCVCFHTSSSCYESYQIRHPDQQRLRYMVTNTKNTLLYIKKTANPQAMYLFPYIFICVRFITTPLNVVDLMSILPTWLTLAFKDNEAMYGTAKVLRVCRPPSFLSLS